MVDQSVDSWNELREHMPAIIDRINGDDRLAVAAAANPILALGELGYRLGPDVRREVEFRLRFGRRTVARLFQLREKVFQAAGHAFEIDSAKELSTVLFDELGLWSDDGVAKQERGRRRPDASPRPVRMSWSEQPEDPLEALRGTHSIMEPLLEYRYVESGRPRMAPGSLYEEIREGRRRLPISRVRARFKAPSEEPEGQESEGAESGSEESGAEEPELREERLDINSASADELESLPGISRAVAERIVEYRTDRGPFARVEDLTSVSGIGDRRLEGLRGHVLAGRRPT